MPTARPISMPPPLRPGDVPEPIGGECAADYGGEAVQDAINEIYGAVTGGL